MAQIRIDSLVLAGACRLASSLNPMRHRFNVLAFHRTFLSVIRKRGRIFEADLLPRYMLKSGEVRRMIAEGTLMDEIRLGLALLKKGRMKILPPRIKGRRDTAKIIKKV